MKCPSCGRENGPTNRFCIFCGSPLPVPRPEEPAQAEKNEYKDDEKVRYKTRAKLSLSHKEPEEADCFVTEGHVVIEATERIKIPLSLVKDFHIHSFPDYSHYSTQVQGPHYIA